MKRLPLLMAGVLTTAVVGAAFGASQESSQKDKANLQKVRDATRTSVSTTEASVAIRTASLTIPLSSGDSVSKTLREAKRLTNLTLKLIEDFEELDAPDERKTFLKEEAPKRGKDLTREIKDLLSIEAALKDSQKQLDGLEFKVVEFPDNMRVSYDLLKSDRPEAVRRFRSTGALLKEHITKLQSQQEALERLVDNSKGAVRSLNALGDSLLKVYDYGGGIFRDFFAFKALDCYEYAGLAAGVRSRAESKLPKLKTVLEEEVKRHRALKENLEQLFDIKI